MKTYGAAQRLLFGMTLVTSPIVAAAQIVADPGAGAQGPTVGQTRNGIPQVDITAPSGAGVSRNAYVQIDVPQPGVVLNNSSAIVQTLQAGMITGNPNLEPGQSAKIIVNEVGGELPSQLRGYLEVAGHPAEVVVANSNGIVADGAGFINATRGILTTGAPIFGPGGGLDGFDVRHGELAVQGAGLNTSNVDQLDLIARRVSADAMIHGKTLNVVAGLNRVDHETLAATPATDSQRTSEVRIDVSGLGGIYASRIALVATEAGVGVSNRGVLAAQEGDLKLTADGRLILSGKTYANGDLALASGDGVYNSGTTASAGGLSVDAVGDVYNSGVLDAQGALKVGARSLVSTGTLSQAGAGPMTIAVAGLFDNSNGTLQTGGTDTHLRSGTLVNDDGRIVHAGTGALRISSDSLSNRGGTIASSGELGIRAADLSNQAGMLSAQRQVDVEARSLDNSQGGYVGAERVALNAQHVLDNRGGALEASEGLAIAAYDVANDTGSIRNSEEGTLSIVAAGAVTNTQGGRIGGNGDLSIVSSVFDNTGGRLASDAGGGGNIILTTGQFANGYGVIESDRDVDVSVTSMAGEGLIVAARDATFRIASDYTHDARNTLHANHDLTLTTLGNFANRGQLGAVNALTVNAKNVDNPFGASLKSASTAVNATGMIRNAGRLEGEAVATRSAALNNVATVIGRTVTLNADVIDNTGASAVIAGADKVNLYASERFSNTGQANVFSLGDINIAADGQRGVSGVVSNHAVAKGHLANRTNTVINDRSTLEARGNLEIAANTLINARPAPVVETVTTGVATKHQRKRDKYMACATGNAVSNSTCSQAVWDFGYKVPRNATFEAARIVSASKGSDPVDRLLVVRANGRQQTPESIYYDAMTEQGDGSITVSYWDGYDPNIHYDPATEYPTRSDAHNGYQRIEMSRDTTTTTREDRAVGIEPPAEVVAGGHITLANVGTVDNLHGAIAAGKSIWIGDGKYDGQVGSMVATGSHGTTTVNNTGRTLYRHETQDIVSRYAWNKEITRDAGPVAQAPVVLPPMAIGRTGGTIVANEALDIHARDIRNTQVAAVDSLTGMTGRTAGAQLGGRDGNDGSRGDTGYGVRDGASLWQSAIAANGILDLKLPTSGLYDIHVAPEHPYLIVTDPGLTSYMQFISSDYMLEQLGLNPQTAQKRLGDGLVEQQEIRLQITALTGRAHLPGYADAQDEYRALMASGVRAARQFDLQPGIALTSAQMDALSSDIVWLVIQRVKLHDGGMTQVLAPIVYLTRAHAGDLRPEGAVVAGDDVELHALGNVANSGVIKGGARTVVTATDVVNRAGTIGDGDATGHGVSGDRGRSSAAKRARKGSRGNREGRTGSTTVVAAARDVVNESGRITGNRVAVLAGRDIVNTTLVDASGRVVLGSSSTKALVAGTSPGAFDEAFPDAREGGSRDAGYGSRASATVLGARGTIASTGNMVVTAGRDLTVHSGEITAGLGRSDGDMQLTAGRDFTVDTVESTTSQSVMRNDRHHWEARKATHQSSLIASGGALAIHSGNDSTFKGARISAGKDLDIGAGGNLVATAVLNDTRFDNVAADDETRQETGHTYDQQAIGTQLSAGRNATLAAGSAGSRRSIGDAGNMGSTSGLGSGNVTLTGSSVTAGTNRGTPGGAAIIAHGDVTLDSASEVHRFDMDVSNRRGSFVSGTSRTDHIDGTIDLAIGSTVSGDAVGIRAGDDLAIEGSNVAGMNDVAMTAEGNVEVVAAQDTAQSAQRHEVKRSGAWGTGGLGFSIGVSKQQDAGSEHAVFESRSRSTVGSVQGNVSIKSDGHVHIGGSDIVAGRSADDVADASGHIDIQARSITIDPAIDTVRGVVSRKTSQYGVAAALGGVVGNALETVNQSLIETNRSDDSRLAALDKMRAVRSSYRAAQVAGSAIESAGGNVASQAKSPVALKATVSMGGGSSHVESRRAVTTNDGSTLSAGGRASIVARGAADDDGDIRVSGTRINAREVSLRAARDIALQSAQDTTQHVATNSSSHASIGVGAAIGGAQNGFTLELGAGGSSGRGDGSRVIHRDTQISAIDSLFMSSGRDMSMLGVEASADTVHVDVRRDLAIASPQNTSTFRSAQSSAGFQASLCMPPFCHGQTVEGSAQATVQMLRNNFSSVGRQSGIRAGEGGYTVEVGSHTQLDGGVLASTAEPGGNSLSTGTFGYSNLQNVARHTGSTLDFRASGHAGKSRSDGVSFASRPRKVGTALGPPDLSGFGPGGFGAAGTTSDASGTTDAAVSPGSIDVRGDIGTDQNSTAGLSRNASRANGSVRDTFDAREVSDDLAAQQRSGQLGMQVVGDTGTALANRAGKAKGRAERAYERAHAVGDAGAMAKARAEVASADRQLALWEEGGIARVASHAVTAALDAATGNGSLLGAAGGTLAGDLVSDAASEAIQDLPGAALLKNAAAGAVGAATGAFFGESSGAVSGANGALNADLYNRQLHSSESEKLAVLKRGRGAEDQQRLMDAACALVHCSAGVPDHDPNRQALVDSESRGSRYTSEQDEIRAAGAFEGYSGLDSFGDAMDRYQVSNRTVGAWTG
ncbi:hemagglutinin repeat-containing protein [Pararobbsia alpina]|uniref:Filamentous haemagglutinin FhaB/tRNA nuclease CdiA-like TPS domain-containing protein n=1 Tax=Pararobbsia alpina TaxID=621374 RepID=A0A6S7C8L2_9BURK|nr:hemagglutinin repeat-containing protein [Pararobbsia alpina]CAB3783732.1 hypothetical protein LMG28138_01698 [Pararobbsia alpina]